MLLRTKKSSKVFHGCHMNAIHPQNRICPYQIKSQVTKKTQTTQFLMELTHLHSHFPSVFHVSPYLKLFIFPWKPFYLPTLSLLSSTPNLLLLPRISSPIPSNPDQILFLSLSPFPSPSKPPLLQTLSDHLSQLLPLGSPISNMGWRRLRFLWRLTFPHCWPATMP